MATSLREKVTILLTALVVLLVLGGALVTCYQRQTSKGQFRREYEGKVVEKYVTNHETQEGTFVTRHILIKNNEGEQFAVVVSPEIFERVQKEMWIRRKESGIELSSDGQAWK